MKDYKKGFISISVVYTFLILFIFLMLAILASYMSRETLLSRLISQAKEVIHGGISEEDVDPNIVVKVYVDGVYSKLFPSYDYYSYNATTSYCTNGARLAFSYNDWSATIENINGRSTCVVNFDSGESNIKPNPNPDIPDIPGPVDPGPDEPDPVDPGNISNVVVNFYADGVYTAVIPKKANGYVFDPYSSKCTDNAILTYNTTNETVSVSNIYENTTCDAYFVKGTPSVTEDYLISGNINLNVYVDNVWSPTFPSKTYYKFNPYKSACSDNAVLSFNESTWKISINNITDKTTCKVYFSSNDLEISTGMFSSGHVNILVYLDGDLSTSVPDPTAYDFLNEISRCTNGATLAYNRTDNNFDVSEITRNTECFAYFQKKE